ncbi:MAG: hypothetical protein D4S01_00555 [Dehalococcoidia bacterium]|nr:MAG: hypothetical protein D4S01_00555 [Dehalococcoidia bacterium]
MDDKKAIMDELLTEERIYLDENATMIINTILDFDDVPESCSKCNGSLEEIYSRPERLVGMNDYDLVVLKCKNCSSFHSFWIEPYTFDDTFITPTKDDMKGRILEPPQWEDRGKPEWGEGKQPKFSKNIAKIYEKTVIQLEDIDKVLASLIQNKQPELYKAGLSNETILAARNKMVDYLKSNSVTRKQLTGLFAAAIYGASHEEYIGVEGYRRGGEKIGEHQLEKLFGITRKTIRRWRSLLKNQYLTKILG